MTPERAVPVIWTSAINSAKASIIAITVSPKSSISHVGASALYSLAEKILWYINGWGSRRGGCKVCREYEDLELEDHPKSVAQLSSITDRGRVGE